MFGPLEIPDSLTYDQLYLKTEYDKKEVLYYRKLYEEAIEKNITGKRKRKLIINPIEPTNIPKPLTNFLLIELENPLLVEPSSSDTIYLTFPLEIGVFIVGSKKSRLIDAFSLSLQKYTLYGEPKEGIICKYWHSTTHHTMPNPSPVIEGVIELSIKNNTTHWSEITKVVFDSYLMKLFYNDEMVSMKGNMRISDKDIALTGFEKVPLIQGMKPSMEVYTLSKLNLTYTTFSMEYGL